ncbi:MAG: phosphatase, partial [Desulfurobacteriaceae bacterium]
AIDFLSSLGVRREKMDYREVISLIREAGGIAVIAHPVTLKLSYSDLYSFIKEAKDVGLEGLEVYHYRHKPADVRVFKEMCRDLDLYYTAGSDFHGENKPCVELGFLNVTVRDIRFPIYCSLFSL